ncbi:MAG: efflux RND transporter periplasmic adaptor subunit [Gammaproteobacteria bacterium]|jgi:membrane fusion protein, multidrug efflux system
MALRLIFLLLIAPAALAQPGAPAKPVPVIAYEVVDKAFSDRVEALGTLRANESVVLTASVTETVSAIHFDDGQRVKAGQLLVEMTSEEEHALLEEAKVRVAEAERQYQRVKLLTKQRTASESLYDERKRDLETARASLAALESRLADRLLRAPFDGVLGLRNISPGALVEPGDEITTLDDDSVMKLDFSVPSVFLPNLQPGLRITASARAYGNRTFEGEVSGIDSRVNPVTRSIQVRAILPNADRVLKPGVLMQVELLRNPRTSPAVPEEALQQQGADQFVVVIDADDKAERRPVSIGARLPGFVEITAGLTAGERVITHGNDKARPGQPVTVKALDDGSRELRDMLETSE